MDNKGYIEFVKTRPCCICNAYPVDAHHLSAIGMGRNRKNNYDEDFTCVPLCRKHHTEYHNSGLIAINNKYGVDLWREAFMLLKAQISHLKINTTYSTEEGIPRTKEQNDYYFGTVCRILGDYFGYEKREMHLVLKQYFKIKNTSKLNVHDFTYYLDNIIRWAATEHNVIIPDAIRK